MKNTDLSVKILLQKCWTEKMDFDFSSVLFSDISVFFKAD